uniref:Interleukin 17d n=1 Tax=Sinocyclocheilus grahami TaxID=75366 RepID=A0A672QA15_SINGR
MYHGLHKNITQHNCFLYPLFATHINNVVKKLDKNIRIPQFLDYFEMAKVITCDSANQIDSRTVAISHDPARYPRYLPEAYCLCKGCLSGPNGEESDRFRSTPVYMPTVILRRTGSCVGGRHSYTESYVSIAVGCTCVPLLERDRKTQKSKPSVKRVSSKNSRKN